MLDVLTLPRQKQIDALRAQQDGTLEFVCLAFINQLHAPLFQVIEIGEQISGNIAKDWRGCIHETARH
jgi:hypothetical protein